ncbi:group 1 glycosyl transferase [Salinigranum rubrum]|uniref:Group 1 glycosyl transferase n=1 Tax=Salinigranum rubrum TaxID=755307 RepID=A0A2I8VLQ5_9EURY|nr:glycosyltransferase [Salinigranum rubrum]AUV82851.1 group 1 glycosyl transferase [Salinigranum rubrum]
MKVLFAPYYASNPYQEALRESLDERGATVEPTVGGLFFTLFRSYLRNSDVDVLHVHWLHAYFHAPWRPLFYVRATMLFVELFVLRLLGVRVVWTLHNLTSHDFPYPETEKRLKRLFVTHFCDAVIAHCNAAIDQAIEEYGLDPTERAKMHVVPHGHYLDRYDTEGARADARAELDLPLDATVLLYFGIIRPYKNVPTLIETFSRVAGDDDYLLVAGNPHTDDVRGAVSRAARGDERVRTRLEYIPAEDVPTYMLAADAVVLPFRDTLTSGSAVLAMSFGRAFVSPRIGCLPELFGDDSEECGAVLYDPDDPNGLGTALRSLDSLDLEAMGAWNRERAAEFDWADIADRTTAVYRDVVRDRRGESA